MSDELSTKTKLGNLDYHLASAGCYVPLMMINVVLPVLFLITEPKESRTVRFHAVQSLILFGVTTVLTVVLIGLSIVLPIGFIVAGGVLGMEDILGGIGMLLQLLTSLVLMGVALLGFVGMVLLAVLAAMEKDPRVPVLASLADRFAGE